MKLHRMIFAALVIAAVLQVVHFYPLMPEKMASHFNAAGQANAWMQREGFVGIYAIVVFAMFLVFVAMPQALSLFPDSMINLPDKAYWLAPERRARTFELIEDHIGMAGNATLALLIGVFQLAFMANLTKEAEMPVQIWVGLAAYIVFMIGWSTRFVRAFSVRRDGQ